MNKRVLTVSVIFLILSVTLVQFTTITVGLTKGDKEYIDFFNRQYDILLEDAKSAEDAYLSDEWEIYRDRVAKLSDDTKSLLWSGYRLGISEKKLLEVDHERIEAFDGFYEANRYAYSADAYSARAGPYSASYREESYRQLKEGIVHLEKAKNSLSEIRTPGFSTILAIAGLFAVAYLLRRG